MRTLCSDIKASELKLHLRKCPSRKQAHKSLQQPYVQPGINLSTNACTPPTAAARMAPLNTTESRSAYAQEIGGEAVALLINKMREIAITVCHQSLKAEVSVTAALVQRDARCGQARFVMILLVCQVGMDQPLRSSVLCPEYCKGQMDPLAEHQANIPMNLKHATQHASIIGNLERLGAPVWLIQTTTFPILIHIQLTCRFVGQS